jgi:hypothetical protein
VEHEFDSGERKAHELELQFTKALGEINGKLDAMPSQIELATVKAVRAHEERLHGEEQKTTNPKLMKGLIGAIIALAGAVATLAATTGM